MDKNSRDPVHCWLVMVKALQAASKYLYAGLAETGIDDTDFRILEALLNKGPLPVNTIGPKVYLTAGSISVAVDRLVERGLVSRVESPEDRRVRIVSLTPKGKEFIAPIFRKHAAEIRKVFADASPKELGALESTLKKIGKRAESLGTGAKPTRPRRRGHCGVVRRSIEMKVAPKKRFPKDLRGHHIFRALAAGAYATNRPASIAIVLILAA